VGGNAAPQWEASVKDIAIGTEKTRAAEVMVGQLDEGRSGNQFLIGQDDIRHHRLLILPPQERILVTGGSTVPVRLSEQP
jgi:hypothetical protein